MRSLLLDPRNTAGVRRCCGNEMLVKGGPWRMSWYGKVLEGSVSDNPFEED